MQTVFVVTGKSDILRLNMKVFKHKQQAQKYQSELRENPVYSDTTIFEQEVIE